jgi:hypothetical protein
MLLQRRGAKENVPAKRNAADDFDAEVDDAEAELHLLDEFTQARTQQLRRIVKREGPYDPAPKLEQVMELRTAYQQLLMTLSEHRQEMIGERSSTHMIAGIVDQADVLYERVRRPVDSVLDSRVLTATSDVGYLRLQALPDLDDAFNVDNLLHWLQRSFPLRDDHFDTVRDGMVDWLAFGQAVIVHPALYRGAHIAQDLLDLLDKPGYQRPESDPTATTLARRQRRQPSANEGAGEQLTAETKAAVQGAKETNEFVIEAFNQLAILGPVSFYRFVLDPRSFARSIENVFYVSFLVKEDRARLYHPKDGDITTDHDDGAGLMLAPILDKDPDQDQSRTVTERAEGLGHQVIGLTMQKWRRLCTQLHIDRPMFNA